ncbi:MAG: hypothetical protein Q9187_006487 [Circinaria calcarea]
MVEGRVASTAQISKDQSPRLVPKSEQVQQKDTKNNAATGASAAGNSSASALKWANILEAFTKAINPRVQAKESWSWRMSTPGLLGHAVKTYGWAFIPNQVLPPLLANIRAVLYTSYLQILGSLYGPSSESTKRIYPPPPVRDTFRAGFAAGTIQSVVAAPLDALQVRFKTSEILEGRYKHIWQYGKHKLQDIGVRGAYAGWGLSFLKDSLGFGVFFSTFEYIKAQSFYAFVTRYYGGIQPHTIDDSYRRGPDSEGGTKTIKPHYTIEPTFLLLAGMSATIIQQLVQYLLALIQEVHYGRLETLELLARSTASSSQTVRNYRQAYEKTYLECSVLARRFGGWRTWLYRGFLTNTLRQVPSTSAGLVIFELVRRRYADESEAKYAFSNDDALVASLDPNALTAVIRTARLGGSRKEERPDDIVCGN